MEEPLKTLPIFALATVLACGGGRAAPPSPDQPPATRPPDLTGAAVMVLPAQHGPGGAPIGEPVPGLDRELAYWLGERLPRVKWVFPPDLDRALERSPSLDINIRALAVSIFHRARVENIGDPLFGDLRRLGALTDTRFALVPVAATYVPNPTGQGRAEVSIALIDTLGGRVLWFGVAAGQPGAEGSTGVAATAASAVASLFER